MKLKLYLIFDDSIKHIGLKLNIAATRKNIRGGQVIFSKGEKIIESRPNLLGRNDIFSKEVQISNSQKNVFGGDYHILKRT